MIRLNYIKKTIYIFFGTLSLILGVAGIFIPVLPTTPLLLLASVCYLRSSKTMYNWLINNKMLGKYIYCYMNYKAIPKTTKIGAIIFLWLTLSISILLMQSMYIKMFLVLVGIAVTWHVITIKTLNVEELKELNKLNELLLLSLSVLFPNHRD